MTATTPQLTIQTSLNAANPFSDSRSHGYQGPTRNVRLQRACVSGGGAISKSEDGVRCAVTGKESLRIVRLSGPEQTHNQDHKFAVGRGGHRIDASRNFWDGSGLKIDSASTDVAWGHGAWNNKILTSARNGEVIMWDLNKSGSTKYERRTKDHIRSINKLSVSHIVQHYCITGSTDGDLRVWDLRDFSKSIMRIHHPTSVRSVVFSPSLWQPLQAVVGLDNGNIYRWDLKMGQRGQLDRLPVAHTASVTALDWCNPGSSTFSGPDGVIGLGWIVSGGLDRTVKVWDLTAPASNAHIPHKPTYILHPSFPVRRVLWRPSYQCELAVVSNAEFGTGSNPDMGPPVAPSGVLNRGSLDVKALITEKNSGTVTPNKSGGGDMGVGDAVEIWDVRRGWIAKWSVTGSTVDGGVTDLTFGDSHAMWAQHYSGMFSQIDLRDATKPLDAIPRVSATWGASGALAFVADKTIQWEAPYDDTVPEKRPAQGEPVSKHKALGDDIFVPASQTMGAFNSGDAVDDLEVLTKLARGYIFEGDDRQTICSANAQIAFQAGKYQAAQVWLLVATCLTDMVPELPPTPPDSPPPPQKRPSSISLPHSMSAPAAMPSASYTFPSPVQKTSPGHVRTSPNVAQRSSSSTSATRKKTPNSSNQSSPLQALTSLPPLTPRPSVYLGRRESVDSGGRRPSMYRRPSVSVHSASPSEKSNPSLRHVGEGALDDSDSSGADDDGVMIAEESSDEEGSPKSIISPVLAAARITPAHPSPLSRVAGQHHWTEDEDGHDRNDDDEASPSPQSTDSEISDSDSPRPRAKSSRSSKRNSLRKKSRSRSSTVASLAAPPLHRPLAHQDSRSSIRTVTAAETSVREKESSRELKGEETIRDFRPQISQTMPEFPSEQKGVSAEESVQHTDPSKLSEREQVIVRDEELRLRKALWDELRVALEWFADEGDVQMCAMLSVIVPQELRISRRRISCFLDAYIDILTRLRLYTSAAYLRKYCQAEDIRSSTLVETIVYTSCGRCRKPFSAPFGSKSHPSIPGGTFSYCSTCRTSSVTCAICRLPVRGLLFQCSVCTHGGHQLCYRRYYMQRPMVHLPGSFLPPPDKRGRSVTRTGDGLVDDDGSSTISAQSTLEASSENSPVLSAGVSKLVGHACAAGCGHYCWAANGDSEEG